MPFEIIEKVVKEVAPCGLREIIPSTMGEPLLYPGFEKIIALCHNHKIKLNLTTNGTFPKKGADLWAESIVPIASDVKISINGASKKTQESIMGGSKLESALKNIRTFCSVRDEFRKNGNNACTITLQLTFLESNLAEIPSMVEMAADMGVNRVKGHHVWTHYPELMDQSLRRSPDGITRWNKIAADCHRIVKSKGRSNGSKLELDNFNTLSGSAANNGHYGGKCPFLGREAWINTEGRFDVCCAPDDLRQQFGDFGNVLENSFMALWNRPSYRNFVKTYASRSLCVSCHMRRPREVK
jgi:MoaA/NifB/PqqE/SkfB family radical SAM enzyme